MCMYLPCMEGGHTYVTRSRSPGCSEVLTPGCRMPEFWWVECLRVYIDRHLAKFEVMWARNGREWVLGVLEARSQQVFEVTFPLWKVGRFRHHVTLTSCFIYQTCQAGYTVVASMLLAAEVNTGGGRTAWGWIGEQGKFLLACSLYFWLGFNLTLLFTAPRAVWHSPFARENAGKWEREEE